MKQNQGERSEAYVPESSASGVSSKPACSAKHVDGIHLFIAVNIACSALVNKLLMRHRMHVNPSSDARKTSACSAVIAMHTPWYPSVHFLHSTKNPRSSPGLLQMQ